jgi:ribosomal protein S18 acetylase RimI-like enzyme
MPEIEIRPATASDIPIISKIEHNYSSEYVWQMEINAEDHQVSVRFREIHLPRSVRVEYPRPVANLADEWTQRSGLLVALLAGETIGYISVMLEIAPATTWIRDLAVNGRARRQGIASALVLAAQEFGFRNNTRRVVMEMQPKNYAAIRLAQKLGFDFCGYNDRYYTNSDIALFFGKLLR